MRTPSIGRRAGAVAALACAGLLATACGSSPPRSAASPPSPGTLSASMGGNTYSLLKTERTEFGTVLAGGTGYTLYWFSKDTAISSACTGVCDSMWPPVTGIPEPAPGVKLAGKLGTITRSDGVVQATYDGHPLYEYAGDFDPGDVGGNGISEFGGRWYAISPAGAEVGHPGEPGTLG